jgi:hypothetical protein
MKPTFLSATALGGAMAVMFESGAWAGAHIVTSNADSGAGTLRAAIEAASAETSAVQIVVATDNIVLGSGIDYRGREPLTLIGQGQTIAVIGDDTILTVSQGADLTVSDLSFEGTGGYSINDRADGDGKTGKGIFVDLRDDQTGELNVVLNNVSVRNVAGHGIHISDCSLADDCGGGSGGAGGGSPASISLSASNLTIANVGHGRFDSDGLRIDERDAGGISVTLAGALFENVGADGVELDEGQDGDVVVSASGAQFLRNGAYCDPDLLAEFMPDPDEAEFEPGVLQPDAVPVVTESPDNGCFEREVDTYEDGSVEAYAFAIDTDDGFDIDEAGPGSLFVVMGSSVISENLDEGLDFDEEGEGSIHLALKDVTASGNTDDGFKLSEADAGDVHVSATGAVAKGNGGKGIVLEQEDGGVLSAAIADSQTSNNDDSDGTGLEAVQEGDVAGQIILIGSQIMDGFDLDNVEIAQ